MKPNTCQRYILSCLTVLLRRFHDLRRQFTFYSILSLSTLLSSGQIADDNNRCTHHNLRLVTDFLSSLSSKVSVCENFGSFHLKRSGSSTKLEFSFPLFTPNSYCDSKGGDRPLHILVEFGTLSRQISPFSIPRSFYWDTYTGHHYHFTSQPSTPFPQSRLLYCKKTPFFPIGLKFFRYVGRNHS